LADRYRQRHPQGSAYVSAYEARPALNVRLERTRRYTPLTFVEAIKQDSSPTTDDLIPAYRVAGDAFPGQMKALFIVLDDDEAAKQPHKAGNQKKKTKRHASGDGSADPQKKMASTQ
jgi:hypothetical protein